MIAFIVRALAFLRPRQSSPRRVRYLTIRYRSRNLSVVEGAAMIPGCYLASRYSPRVSRRYHTPKRLRCMPGLGSRLFSFESRIMRRDRNNRWAWTRSWLTVKLWDHRGPCRKDFELERWIGNLSRIYWVRFIGCSVRGAVDRWTASRWKCILCRCDRGDLIRLCSGSGCDRCGHRCTTGFYNGKRSVFRFCNCSRCVTTWRTRDKYMNLETERSFEEFLLTWVSFVYGEPTDLHQDLHLVLQPVKEQKLWSGPPRFWQGLGSSLEVDR